MLYALQLYEEINVSLGDVYTYTRMFVCACVCVHHNNEREEMMLMMMQVIH